MTLVVVKRTCKYITIAADRVISFGDGLTLGDNGNKITYDILPDGRKWALGGCGDLSAVYAAQRRGAEYIQDPYSWEKKSNRIPNVEFMTIDNYGNSYTFCDDGAIVENLEYAAVGHSDAVSVAMGALAVGASITAVFRAVNKHCPIIGREYDYIQFRV